MPQITITGSDAAEGTLTLSDNGTTDANRGSIVTWVIAPGSGVSAITSILHDVNSNEVFSPLPHKLPGNSTTWQGTINSGLTVPPTISEDYTICWNDTNGNNHCFDPKIRVIS